MLISGCDLAFAGAAFDNGELGMPLTVPHLASLAHLVTRIVLSERIAFVYSPGSGSEEPPTSYVLPLIERHCKTLQIDERYAPVEAIVSQIRNDPAKEYGDALMDQTHRSTKRYAPWSDGSLAAAILAEYGVARLLQVPFAPNPIVSTPLSLHSLRGRTTGDELLRYVEDLRRQTSNAMNLHKGLNIYDLNVPAIFGVVLRESREPKDLIFIASQMNDDAKAFRSWCASVSRDEESDPNKYIQRLEAAKESLKKLGQSLNTQEAERMQVTSGSAFGINLPSPGLKKLISFFDVDLSFLRPRSFLLNLLSSARQVKSLAGEISRVFRIPLDHAKALTEGYLKIAEDDALSYRATPTGGFDHQ